MRKRRVDDESFCGKTDRRSHYPGEWERAVLPLRLQHSGDRSRHARSFRSDQALAGELAVRAHVHVARRRERRGLTIVDGVGATVCHSYHHVTAAAKISRLGICDSERKASRNCPIDGIPALLHHLRPNLGREPIVAGDERVRGECRLTSRGKTPRSGEHSRDTRGDRRIARQVQREGRRCQEPRSAREDHRGDEQFLLQNVSVKTDIRILSTEDRSCKTDSHLAAFRIHGSEKDWARGLRNKLSVI